MRECFDKDIHTQTDRESDHASDRANFSPPKICHTSKEKSYDRTCVNMLDLNNSLFELTLDP